MAFEQALLSKHVAKDAIENSDNPVTMQTDGTSKKHIPYVAMLASTDTGTYGIGLTEVETENSEILQETISTMEQLLTIDDLMADKNMINQLLLKIKNTMTDRCIVNNKFIELLEEWRETMLPKMTKDWDKLSEDLKESMTTVNDLYCGKHVNLQEYVGAALSDWESVEASGAKIGIEKHLLWHRKESATFLAIRTVCEAFGPDASAQAGCPIEFNDYLNEIGDRNRLNAYCGNRFNVPFVNGAAVYYMYHHRRGHINAVYKTLPSNKQNNQLTRSVMYDLEDKIVVVGIRAMSIINSHITLPLMRMLDKA